MFKNLTGKQILIIILVIILVLWFIGWLMGGNKKKKIVQTQVQKGVVQQPPVQIQQPVQLPVQSQQPITIPIGPEISSQQENTPYVLYNFYDPNCPACKAFKPNWNKAASHLNRIKGLSVHAIDVTKPENENLSLYYNIVRLPTIILVTPDKNIEYSGDRSVDDLQNFVLNNITQQTI